MMATVPTVTLDVLPLKRVLGLEEAGNEFFPVEPEPEEKPLALLGRIDFSQTVQKDLKKAKIRQEAAPVAQGTWPWQGLADHLQQAHQELNIILDFITQVEANDAINVSNMVKPKVPPHEAFNDLALRSSSKICQFRDVGKYLRRTAQALERQVEREAVFYGALMRLQCNWKVKRQRGAAAGPGGSAGFSIDTSFPLPADITFVSSARAAALSFVNLDQDSMGLLQAQLPAGRPLNKLNLSLHATKPGRTVGEGQDRKHADISAAMKDSKRGSSAVSSTDQGYQSLTDGRVGEGVDTGAKAAQAVLRHVQSVIYDEQVFEWAGREGVLSNSGMNVIGIGDMCLQFSLGHAASLTLELSQESEKDSNNTECRDQERQTDKGDEEAGGKWNLTQSLASTRISERMTNYFSSPRLHKRSEVLDNSSLTVCLHQAFHQGIFGFPVELDPGLVTFKMGVGKGMEGSAARTKEAAAAVMAGKEPATVDGASAIKHFSAVVCHRVLSSRVLAELEKQVSEVPHFHLFLHPTWQPRVSAWDLSLATPTCTAQKCLEWASSESQEVRFQCTVVLRDEVLTVEGLEGESRFEAPSKSSPQVVLPVSKHSVGLSELPTFLLFQVAMELVSWLHDEGLTMGLKVSRDLLSVVFQLEGCDDVAIVACPDVKVHCINWWMRTWSSGTDDSSPKDDFGLEIGHCQCFLGPLDLGMLRNVVLDLVNLESSLEECMYD